MGTEEIDETESDVEVQYPRRMYLGRPRRRPFVTASQSDLVHRGEDCSCTDGQIFASALVMALSIIIVMFVYWHTFGV